jgi:UDP-2,3-diacylglucosamine hydrolase
MIAGNGIYPETFARAARRAGVAKLAAAAFVDETDPALAGLVDVLEWMRVGQLGKMIKFFKAHGVAEAVMVGQIAPKNLFDLRPDLRTLKMLAGVKVRNAESLFGAIAGELEKDGITLLPATTFLDDLLPGPGPVCGPALKDRQIEDAEFGFRIAKEVSRLDIGQTVVVKKGTVLAVEAFEGTNEALKRGGALGKGGAMMVKVSKPNQDLRFDVPVVGPATIDAAVESGVNAIVVEAGKTLLLGKDEVVRRCGEKGVSIFAKGA